MNRRESCTTCSRPVKTCLCKFVQQVSNTVPVIILQHPLEVFEAKNSAALLHLCLKNSQIEVGETFGDSFFNSFESADYYDLLLYPHINDDKSPGTASYKAPDVGDLLADKSSANRLRLWVVDGTWRKSRKMLYLNPKLQSMPRLSLDDCPSSIYKIRKAHSENQLSTLEASCYALRQLEHNSVDYSPILRAFAAFVAEQQAFLPSAS